MMMNRCSICLFIILSFTTISCGFKAAPWARPNSKIFAHKPISQNPDYSKGWDEGCESGMTAHTNNYYQSFYSYKLDASMVKNEVYYKAFQDAYIYCRLYAYTLIGEAGLKRSLPNAHRTMLPTQKGYGILDWMDNWGNPLSNRW
jgi:hypothetical protein